jgi:hypothetical protein
VSNAISQTVIRGQINFSNNEKNLPVSVILKDQENILAYTISDEYNRFEIQTNKTGNFEIVFSSISMETQKQDVVISKPNQIIQKNVYLIYKPIELNEILIKSDKPIVVKKDTIVFTAKEFLNGNERVVEDLLRKIPGITVSDDGVIKIGNQEVEKIMIDGDDMFEKGYKILTKNMPVRPINKVELYQNYSNNKLLKGIENSQKVALNLRLKDDFKRQWFGNAELAYGVASENRYEVRTNLMNFGKKNKYYLLKALNNVGFDAVGDLNSLIRPNRSYEIGNFGDNQIVKSTILLGGTTPALKPKRTNFNNAELISLNSIFTLSPKIKLKALSLFNFDEINYFRNSTNTFLIGNSNFTNSEDYFGRVEKTTYFNKLDFIYSISNSKTFEFSSRYTTGNQGFNSEIKFNQDVLNEILKSNNNRIDQFLLFTNKYKENKVFVISGRLIVENLPQEYGVNKFVYQDLFQTNNTNLEQTAQTKMLFYGTEFNLLDRKQHGNLVEIKSGFQHRTDFFKSNLFLKNQQTIISQPTDFQNDLVYSTDNLYFKTKYSTKFKKAELFYQAGIHQLFNTISTDGSSKFQNAFFINPKVDLVWELNSKNKVLSSLSYNTTNAEIQEVYNNYINTGFRSFSKGTGDFNQLDATNFSLNYTVGNFTDRFFGNIIFNYTTNHDFFSTNTIETQNYSQSEKIIIKNRTNFYVSSETNRYFSSLKSNIKLKLDASKSNYKNKINDSQLRIIESTFINYGLEARSSFKGFFNYHIGSSFNYNEIKSSFKNSFTNSTSFLNLLFKFNKNNMLEIKSERFIFGNVSDVNNKYYFFDIEHRCTIIENKIYMSLIGTNLFNVKTFKETVLSDIYSINNTFRLQPRYVMMRLEYSF